MTDLEHLPFRLLVDEPAAGSWNMAVDHALLDHIEGEGGHAAIRLYSFSPPTISLGRFQAAERVLLLSAVRRDGVPVVRRPTGGQAVLHHTEITYSVVLARRHLQPFTKRSVYRAIAGVLSRVLDALGVEAHVQTHRVGDPRGADCFRTTSEYEITTTARKLIGSAQLLTRAGALQHGSIPLDGSYRGIARYLTPPASCAGDPTSLAEAMGEPLDHADALTRMVGALRGVLDVSDSQLSTEERTRAAGLENQKYSRDTWNIGA